MARFKKSEPEYGKVESVEITRAKEYSWGISFTMVLNGVTINNCSVGVTKSGDNFISLPSYKGKDGKWYSYVYFRFSEKDLETILDKVAELVANTK